MFEDDGLLPVIEDASDVDKESRLRLRRVDAPSDDIAPAEVMFGAACADTDVSASSWATWTEARTLKPLESSDRPTEVSSEVDKPPADSLILEAESDSEEVPCICVPAVEDPSELSAAKVELVAPETEVDDLVD